MLYIGVDLGTSAVKLLLMDETGDIKNIVSKEYPLFFPHPGWSEQNPEDWFEKSMEGIKELTEGFDRSKVAGISFGGQMHGLVALDKDDQVIRPAILWNDGRTGEETDYLNNVIGKDKLSQYTANIAFAGFTAPKILWIKNHEPEVFEKTDRFLLLEDYLIYRMTGRFYTEGSLVCSSMYWDITKKCYWKEMLDFIGIEEYQLAEVAESAIVVDEMFEEVREELGLPCKVTVTTGALDQAAGAIGAGNIKEGMFSETIGAALAICAPVSHPVFDPNRKMPLHYFALPDTYMIHTFTTGGMTLRWFRDKFCTQEMAVEAAGGGDAYDLISREVEKIAPGCDGLVMLPHLSGSLAPDVNAKAKGVWFGFSLNHTKAHFARAIMESLAFILRRNLSALADMGITVKEVRSLGGGSKSPVWNQIKADANDITLVTVKSKEAACLGAAILAGTATGVFKSVEDAVENMIRVKDRYTADPGKKPVYDKNYEMYCKLFKDLTECFDKTV